MKKLLVLSAMFPFLAFAGKAEREYMAKTVNPAVDAATTAFKTSCGCDLKISLAATVKSEDDMYQAKHIAESITGGAATYCTDDASKKAMCQLKALEITKTKETKFSFTGGRGVASTDGQSYVSWDMMTQELDK